MKRALCLVSLLATVGCGGTSITGTVNGVKISATNAIFFVDQGFTVVAASNQSDLCSQSKDNYLRANEDLLLFELFSLSADGNRTSSSATGSYSVAYLSTDDSGDEVWAPVTSGLVAEMQAQALNPNCIDNLLAVDATTGLPVGLGVGGSVTISKFSSGSGSTLNGSFNAILGAQGDSLTGSFEATYCDAPVSSSTTPQPACK